MILELRTAALLTAILPIGANSSCSDDPNLVQATGESTTLSRARDRRGPLESVRWILTGLEMVTKHKPSPPAELRALAYQAAAQLGAVERATDKHRESRATIQGAIAGASATVLAYAYPQDSALFEAAIEKERAELPPRQREGFDAGIGVGRGVGRRVLVRARSDRFDAPWTGTVPVGPGFWVSSLEPPQPPWFPTLGQMRPLLMSSGSQFRPGPPPAFGSPLFQEDLALVRRISDTRTAEQDSIAKLWDARQSLFWTTEAIREIEHRGLGERDAAYALALLFAAAMDAAIASFDAKYTHWLLRPIQADPQITLAIFMPNFPAYTSGHAIISGTVGFLLDDLFPNKHGRFSRLAAEAAISRVYGGIHYKFDVDSGLAQARRLSRFALGAGRRGALLLLSR